MAHAQRAHALQDEFKASTGIRPRYPRSRVAFQDLGETLDRYIAAEDAAGKARDRYIAAQDAVQARDTQKQGAKAEAEEFARLGQMDVYDNFDLDGHTTAGELEGEPARL